MRGEGAILVSFDSEGKFNLSRAWFSQSPDPGESVVALQVADDGSVYAVGNTDRAYGVWRDVSLDIYYPYHAVVDWEGAWYDLGIIVQPQEWHQLPLTGKEDLDVLPVHEYGNHQLFISQVDTAI
jgi:hypothetical protein